MELTYFMTNAKALIESNVAFFSRKADSARSLRSKDIIRYYEGIDRNQAGHAVTKWRIPSASSNKTWNCYISIEPANGTLFSAAQGVGRLTDRMNLIKNADVRCYCTCPDFKYSGAAYNMKHLYNGYELGHRPDDGGTTGEDIPPDVRDPQRKHVVCKHILAAFKGILLNAPRIIKDARTARFPSSEPEEQPAEILNSHANDANNAGGEITALNGSGNDRNTDGKITVVNGNDRKPVVDYESDAKNIKVLGESAPVRTPEASSALDALSTAIGEVAPEDTSGSISALNGDDVGLSDPENSDITVLNGDSANEKFDPITGLEDAAHLPMFNPPMDESDLDDKNAAK